MALTTADLPAAFRPAPPAAATPLAVRAAVLQTGLSIDCPHDGCLPCIVAASREVTAAATASASAR